MRRPLIVAAAVTALAGAFAAGGLMSADDPDPYPEHDPSVHVAPVSYTDSCDDLLATYVERAVHLVGPWGWDGGQLLVRDLATADGFSGSALRAAAAPVAQRATSGDSGTNVQELGVDEPDVVKTDGSILVRLDDGVLTTYDVEGGAAPAELGRLVLDGARDGELLLAEDVATVVAPQRDGLSTRLLSVDLADPAAPVLAHTTDLDGTLLAARLHGTTVRAVVTAGLPDLSFVHPGRRRTDAEAMRLNQALVRATTIEDWAPTSMLDCADVAVPDEPAGVDTVTVVGFDSASPEDTEVQGVLASARIAYFSAGRLYLADGRVGGGWGCCGTPTVGAGDPALQGTTTLHLLDLRDTGVWYRSSGRVDGYVADRWAMDEARGTLRLAVGPSELTDDFNSVVTIGDTDGGLLYETGRVDRLGVGEQIQSVRWSDDLAIVVTFRQVDPLYAVDLSDDRAPRLLGELKIPGFSEYLHPLGSMRMIGLGQGPSATGRGWGAQAGLFDVTDLTAPRRLDVLSYGGGTQALAGTDPRQLTWLPDARTVLTVVADWRDRTGYVSVIHLGDSRMTNRMVEVEHGSDVADVRTVPLPDGRVVLVTGRGRVVLRRVRSGGG